eukprot:tig00000492_g1458.t1
MGNQLGKRKREDASPGDAHPPASCSEDQPSAPVEDAEIEPLPRSVLSRLFAIRRFAPKPESPTDDTPAGAATEAAPGEAASPFRHLPDGVLSQIFELLGLRTVAVARLMCRRWRNVAETFEWRNLELAVESVEQLDQIASQIASGGQECGGRRWIRLAPGASLRLEVDRRAGVLRASDGQKSPWEAALALASACAAASGGLGEVDLTCDSSGPSRSCFGGLLGALAPPGGAACAALRSVSIQARGLFSSYDCKGLPAPAEFEPLLRPFPNLEGLSLPVCCTADRASAAALAQSLPRLKRLEMSVGRFDAVAGLASLSSLEFLQIHNEAFEPPDAAPLIEGLASGPAARSLKELFCVADLSGAALRALPRLAALESFCGPLGLKADAGADDVAALGSCAALKSLAGLVAALGRSSSIADLELRLGTAETPPGATELEALAALAGAARGRLSLELEVDLEPGWPAQAAAALAPAPPRRLVLSATVSEPAMEGGWLAGLAAFANCSEDIEVRVRTGSDGEDGGG